MSEANVALVQDLIAALRRQDADAVMVTLDAAVEWTPVEADDSGYAVHRGQNNVRAWLTRRWEAQPGMHWEADRVEDADGETVVALARMADRGAVSDAGETTAAVGVIFTVRAGRIMRIAEYADPSRALVAAGLGA